METMTRDEQRNRLDEFARIGTDEQGSSLPVPVQPPHAMQVFGAQAVAVRRDDAAVLQKIKVLAAAAGEEWYYRFPVKNRKENRTDWIEGPSIKLANAVALLYGNCEVDCRAQDLGSVILYHARFLDLETGYALTRPFQQRKGAAKMGDAARAEDITFQIGASKAIRNVVVNALQTLADFAFAEARNALVDKIGRDLPKWRERTVERISARVELARVEAVVGRKAADWLAPDVARVIAMGKAVDDGMATWDETFPALGISTKSASAEAAKDALDAFTEQSMVNQTSDSEIVDGLVSEVGDGATEDVPKPTSSAVAPEAVADQRAMIDTAMRLAVNVQLTEQEKREQLDNLAPAFDRVPEAFAKVVTKYAADVAGGKIKADAARRYLEGMVKR